MRLIIATLFWMVAFPLAAQPPTSFDSGKKAAVDLWWDIGGTSFYCSCTYRPASVAEKKIRKGNLWVDANSCPYEPQDPLTSSGKVNARVSRIEWEHVVPADWIATGFNCQDQTRDECRAIPGFKEAEGDLFNLVPAVGEINGDRSARPYGEIAGEQLDYGTCDFEVTTVGTGPAHLRGMAEPKPAIRGDLARIWFYMIDRYGVKISQSQKAMFDAWNAADPVDQAELDRHALTEAVMGWKNKFVVP